MLHTRILAAGFAVSFALGCRERGPRETTGQTTLTSAESPATAAVTTGAPDVPALVAKVSPGVVNITATQELKVPEGAANPFEFFFGERRRGPGERDRTLRRHGLGTGFILDDAGHVATNAHVVENATTVRVTLADQRELDAKVKGRDERLDVAILELQGAKDLPRVPLGHSDELRVGEFVVAIGNPFGLGNTVTMGIVSAKGRELGAGPYDDFIQTDASINPGNSGGPLFNVRGEVVGISTAIVPAGQGIGFAIPIDALRAVLPQLLEKGVVSRGKLGVAIQQVDGAMAKALGLDGPRGALIADLEPGGAAVKAGLVAGDVVVAVGRMPVVRAHDLPRIVGLLPPGSKVQLDVVGKNGTKRKVDVVLDELREKGTGEKEKPMAPPSGMGGDFGLELGDDPKNGITVRGIDPGSAAADELEPGDVILEVNGAPVKTARDAFLRMHETRRDRPLLLKVLRDGRSLFVAIERR